MAIEPTQQQVDASGILPQDQPVIFLNCHKYFERARYPDGYIQPNVDTDVSGKEDYHRYLWSVETDFMPQVGGRFILVGPVELVLIGEGDWDEIVVGEYPSREEAFRMQTLDGYADINVHREAGLANVMTMSFTQSQFDRLSVSDAWINRL